MSTSSIHRKQITALKLAIESLKRERRRLHAAGDHAYRKGFRTVDLGKGRITGTTLGFAEADHAGYVEYTQAIQQLEDLIEIILDPGANQVKQLELIDGN